MGKPSHKFLPSIAKLVPALWRELKAVGLVFVEEMGELLGGFRVNDESVFFVVKPQAAGVEVGTAHSTEPTIYGNDFGVMKSRFVHPNGYTLLHEPVYIVEHAIGGQRDVAVSGNHDFYLHTSPHCIAQSLLQTAVQGEVRIDELDAIPTVFDGFCIKVADDFVTDVWFAIDDAHHFSPCRRAGVGLEMGKPTGMKSTLIELGTMNVLMSYLIPYSEKDALKGVHLVALYPTVHVSPTAYDLCTFYIIVGHVHSAGISDVTIDDNDFPMVAMKHVINPGKTNRIELIDFDSALA